MTEPRALVLGDLDLIRPLRRAGISCAAALAHDDPGRFSRFVRPEIEPLDHWNQQAQYAERLRDWAAREPERPVLFYQTDGDLLTVSRHREILAPVFTFLMPSAPLVEDLVDKARFAELADRLELPVPRSQVLRAATSLSVVDLSFPLIVKPLLRHALVDMRVSSKAVLVHAEDQLKRLVESADGPVDLLVQELVPGPESAIESYHAYIDEHGAVVAEFTGRKIRTHPREFGHTTALEITRTADVAELGRDVLSRLGLVGVAKIDLKRDPRGRLHLLEVNPRFNLWHSPGAVAGVNLPATVWADLTGRSRPPLEPVRAGVTWCSPHMDHWAVNDGELGTREWLATVLTSSVRSGLDWDDPGPMLRGILWPKLSRRRSGRRAGRSVGA